MVGIKNSLFESQKNEENQDSIWLASSTSMVRQSNLIENRPQKCVEKILGSSDVLNQQGSKISGAWPVLNKESKKIFSIEPMCKKVPQKILRIRPFFLGIGQKIFGKSQKSFPKISLDKNKGEIYFALLRLAKIEAQIYFQVFKKSKKTGQKTFRAIRQKGSKTAQKGQKSPRDMGWQQQGFRVGCFVDIFIIVVSNVHLMKTPIQKPWQSIVIALGVLLTFC
jgi:hypothetical protein